MNHFEQEMDQLCTLKTQRTWIFPKFDEQSQTCADCKKLWDPAKPDECQRPAPKEVTVPVSVIKLHN